DPPRGWRTVVAKRDAAYFAAELKPSRHAAEPAHRLDGGVERRAKLEGERGGAGRVGGVVPSRNRQLDDAELPAVVHHREPTAAAVALVGGDAVGRGRVEAVGRGAGAGASGRPRQ